MCFGIVVFLCFHIELHLIVLWDKKSYLILLLCLYVFCTASNKARLLEAGVMRAVLELKHTEVMAVVFKLLGVLRMLTDGQGTKTASALG